MKNNRVTQTTMMGLLKRQSTLLLISMLLSFVLLFLIETFYYANHVLADKVPGSAYAYGMGIGIAIMVQFCRLAFGISGAYEFAKGNTGTGLAGLFFSLVLAIWCAYEVGNIADAWATVKHSLEDVTKLALDHQLYNHSMLVLQFLVWSGFALEIRLALAMSKVNTDESPNTEVVTQNGTLAAETSTVEAKSAPVYSANGNGHATAKK